MSYNLLTQALPNRLLNNAPLVVICLLLVDSFHFVFARLLLPHLPPTTSAMYVLAVGTVEVALFMGFGNGIRLEIFRRHAWFFLSIGFLVAASTALTYGSVEFIDPGTASLLSKMSTLFSLGFGVIWLRERFTLFEWVGVLAAIAGTFVITFQPGDFLWLGVLMVIASTFMYALHAALVKRHDGGISLTDFFLFRLACTTAFLFLFSLGRGELTLPSGPTWLILLLAGTVDVTISRTLYYLTLRRLNLSVHALILTLSPVASILWTVILFGINPTWQQFIGGAAIIGGVLMVSTSQARGTKPKGQ